MKKIVNYLKDFWAWLWQDFKFDFRQYLTLAGWKKLLMNFVYVFQLLGLLFVNVACFLSGVAIAVIFIGLIASSPKSDELDKAFSENYYANMRTVYNASDIGTADTAMTSAMKFLDEKSQYSEMITKTTNPEILSWHAKMIGIRDGLHAYANDSSKDEPQKLDYLLDVRVLLSTMTYTFFGAENTSMDSFPLMFDNEIPNPDAQYKHQMFIGLLIAIACFAVFLPIYLKLNKDEDQREPTTAQPTLPPVNINIGAGI